MGEVIYSATLLQTFVWAFVIVLALMILGLVGVLNGIFRRKEKAIVRIARGGAGISLFVIGVALTFVTFRSITNGSKTINVHLDDKQIANDNCGDSSTCTRYVLETQGYGNFYDLDVNEKTYNLAEIDSCYVVTYYPNEGLMRLSDSNGPYKTVSNITRIETTTCP
jgi:hypothetical protein